MNSIRGILNALLLILPAWLLLIWYLWPSK
jgi:hypothetical protein